MGLNSLRKPDSPRIFISSTSYDLREHRSAAQRVASNLHLTRIVLEDFESDGRNPPLHECLRRVREEADVLVVILAKRYGWVPSEDWPDLPPEQTGKSITWLECLEARRKGIAVLPFVLDEEAEWPEQLEETNRREALGRFRAWIDRHYIAKRFASLASLQDELTRALDRLKSQDALAEDPARYFEWISGRAMRTLNMPGREASLDRMYIPLPAQTVGKARAVESFFATPYLVIAAGPGAGKSTVLAKYACDLAREFQKTDTASFPVLLEAAEFWSHIVSYMQRHEPGSPVAADSPVWISHFLRHESEQRGWGLSGAYCERLLTEGKCAILVDGFDQADRHRMGLLIDQVRRVYPRCQIVVASRPWAVVDAPGLERFVRISIAPLDNAAIRGLLLRWCRETIGRPDAAQHHANAMYGAIVRSPAVRRLARYPLILSVIAQECGTPSDLPSSRAELYETIVKRLLGPARDGLGRNSDPDPAEALQELAWAMHTGPARKAEATIRWAGEQVRKIMPGTSVAAAARQLEDIAARTGVLTVEQDRVRFWHPTLQEFLAARRLAYVPAEERLRILTTELCERLTSDEWQQVLLFLAQLLEPETDDLEALLSHLLTGSRTTLSRGLSARYAASIVALERELSRFPDRLRSGCAEIAEAMQDAFASGNLEGIDLPARIELSRLLGSGGHRPCAAAWIEIPAGEFWIGAQKDDPAMPRYDPDAKPSEGPVRRVKLGAYRIGRFPVTVQRFADFIADKGYARPEFWRTEGQQKSRAPLRWDEQLEFGNHPVTGVSWYEAAAFSRWANSRLPTAAEWERAAAGPEGRRFPWGNQQPDRSRANFNRMFGGVTPVDVFPEHASAELVNDLAGNVWEWTADDYDQTRKTLRGGSHQNGWRFLRTSARIGARPHERYTNFGHTGFRCVSL